MPNKTDTDSKKGRMLAEDFSPCAHHVIIGRGKKIANHKANCNLRAIVKKKLYTYQEADKTSKSFLLMNLVRRIEVESPDGIGFVKLDPATKRWHVAPPALARANVAQAFRDNLSAWYRSSKHSKQHRRMIQRDHPNAVDTNNVPSAVFSEKQCNSDQHAQDQTPISVVSAFVKGVGSCDQWKDSSQQRYTAQETLTKLRRDGIIPSPPPRQVLTRFIDQALDTLGMDGVGQRQPLPFYGRIQRQQLNGCQYNEMGGWPQQQLSPAVPIDSAENLMMAPLPTEDDDDDLLSLISGIEEEDDLPELECDAFCASETTSSFFLQQQGTGSTSYYASM